MVVRVGRVVERVVVAVVECVVVVVVVVARHATNKLARHQVTQTNKD